MNEQQQLAIVANAAVEKHAEDLIVLNMRGISIVADYFVICHGNSHKQVQAISREIKKQAEEAGINVKRMEGFDEAKWVLVDLGDIVVHVFHRDDRDYYHLERLWGDAPIEEIRSGNDR